MDKKSVIDCCSGGARIFAVKVIKINLSVCLALCLLYVAIILYSNAATSQKEQESNSINTDHFPTACQENFNATLADNLEYMIKYPKGVADQYMRKIGGNMSIPKEILQFPVIATAFHKLHYPESMGLFRSIHQHILHNAKYKASVRIIVYDIGLTGRQLKMLKAKCKCEVRPFPFKELPSHIRMLDTYAFKPIIVQMLLMEFGFVWWTDSSVRFTTRDVETALNFATRNSILFYVKHDISKSNTVARQTDLRTFSFLKEDVCKFRNFSETVGAFVLFHFDNVSKIVVSAWARCALNKDCIAPESADLKKPCYLEQLQDGRCHKFDQSVLSILTRRLYRDTDHYPVDVRLNDIFEIKKSEIDHYFESCRPMLKCLA